IRDEVRERVAPRQLWVAEPLARGPPVPGAGKGSCLGCGMLIVGNIECKGQAQVFGRIEGELRASDLLIGNGAQVEGNVIAQNVTVCGRVKGTIRAVRVKLQNGGVVEGDIFHRSLSTDETSQFEGSSRRIEKPIDSSSSVDPKGSQKKTSRTRPRPGYPPSTPICGALKDGLRIRVLRWSPNLRVLPCDESQRLGVSSRSIAYESP